MFITTFLLLPLLLVGIEHHSTEACFSGGPQAVGGAVRAGAQAIGRGVAPLAIGGERVRTVVRAGAATFATQVAAAGAGLAAKKVVAAGVLSGGAGLGVGGGLTALLRQDAAGAEAQYKEEDVSKAAEHVRQLGEDLRIAKERLEKTLTTTTSEPPPLGKDASKAAEDMRRLEEDLRIAKERLEKALTTTTTPEPTLLEKQLGRLGDQLEKTFNATLIDRPLEEEEDDGYGRGRG